MEADLSCDRLFMFRFTSITKFEVWGSASPQEPRSSYVSRADPGFMQCLDRAQRGFQTLCSFLDRQGFSCPGMMD